MILSNRSMHSNCLPLFSFTAALFGQVFLYYFKLPIPGILLFLLSAGLLLKYNAVSETTLNISKIHEAMIFSLIIILSAVLRLVSLDSIPAGFYVDEADGALIADRLASSGGNMGEFPSGDGGAYLFIISAFFKLFGAGALQMRMGSALLGVMAVAAVYFLMRYLAGPAMGIAGAFLLAVMRWHINFSRIGFNCILLVTLLALTLYYVIRAYRKAKTGDFILAAVTAVLCQYTYMASRLLAPWLAVVLLYIFITDRKFFAANLKNMAAAVFVAMLLYAPLGLYSIKKMPHFFERQSQVSLFDREVVRMNYGPDKNMAAAISDAVIKTLGMFNFRGDMNGRHNLPGSPALDFFTGLAAAAGFGFILFGPRRFENFAFISYFLVFACAGFFSIEAPQSLRVITVIPALIYFALSYLRVIAGSIKKPFYAALFIAALLSAAAAWNICLYFGPQAHDAACRKNFSLDEYQAASYVNKLGPGWRVLIADNIYNYGSTFRFIAGDGSFRPEMFDVNNILPFIKGEETDTAFLISKEYYPISAALKNTFPAAAVTQGKDPLTGDELCFTALAVRKEEIKQWLESEKTRGLTGRYYEGPSWSGKPVFSEKKYLPLFFWTVSPIKPPSSAEWSGRLMIDAPGPYTFLLQSRDYSSLRIDGKIVAETTVLETSINKTALFSGTITLSKGFHHIKLKHSVQASYYKLFLWWIPPFETEKSLVPPSALYQ